MTQKPVTNPRIFRITHIQNLPWLLHNGLHCKNSSCLDPNFRVIGNTDLIDRRSTRQVPIPPAGYLSDYVPFYFTPYSPMLLNIKTGWNVASVPMRDIIIITSFLGDFMNFKIPVIFTDRHAYLKTAMFFDDPANLDKVDLKLMYSKDISADPNDPGKNERRMAEVLVYKHVPVSTFEAIACYDSLAESRIQQAMTTCKVSVKIGINPGWYF